MCNDRTFPAVGAILLILAIPYNLLVGFVTGLVAPVAAIAGMVVITRLLTGRVPFLRTVEEEEDGEGRYLSLALVPPDEVGELYAQHKEEIGGDLSKLRVEIKAIMEEAKAEAEAVTQEEAEEAPAEV